ncbi:hypothetical protein DUGA6_03350 [Duganella sp. HH105]|nr:hypothetical protein DUGA6_03350 [Duganella sp. HH105]OFA07012.1 hypothetical protein DUGA2_03440 [Duganella sp. HH101]
MRWYSAPSRSKCSTSPPDGPCHIISGYVGLSSFRHALAAQLRQFSIALCGELLGDFPLSDHYTSGVFVAVPPTKSSGALLFNCLAKCLRSTGVSVVHFDTGDRCGADVLRNISDQIRAQTTAGDEDQAPCTLTEVVRSSMFGGSTLVLLIENIDLWAGTWEGCRALRALKSCRDDVNLSSDCKSKLLIVGSGEPAKMVTMTRDSAQAFYGAALTAVPGCRDKALAGHAVNLSIKR